MHSPHLPVQEEGIYQNADSLAQGPWLCLSPGKGGLEIQGALVNSETFFPAARGQAASGTQEGGLLPAGSFIMKASGSASSSLTADHGSGLTGRLEKSHVPWQLASGPPQDSKSLLP